VGKRKINEQVFPESDEGMSKLNTDETVEEMTPKYEVPGAVVGLVESRLRIKWGNS